jgi:hypothetical protein
MTREGLDLDLTRRLLRAATTMQRYAELACSSEEADRDRVPCPEAAWDPRTHKGRKRVFNGPCLCDFDGEHHDIPRIRVKDWNIEQRVRCAMPAGWAINTQGDPRGYVLRVIPPSYTERNAGQDRHNLESIGVPSGPTRLRF